MIDLPCAAVYLTAAGSISGAGTLLERAIAEPCSHHQQQKMGWSAVAWVQLGVNEAAQVSFGGQLGARGSLYINLRASLASYGVTGSTKGLCPLMHSKRSWQVKNL